MIADAARAFAAVRPPGEAATPDDGRVYVMRPTAELQICIARPRNIEEAEQVRGWGEEG